MMVRVKQWLWIAGGWALIALGITGLLLPILHGAFFLILGLLILSSEYAWAHRMVERIRTRFPRLHGLVDRAQGMVYSWRGITPKPGASAAD